MNRKYTIIIITIVLLPIIAVAVVLGFAYKKGQENFKLEQQNLYYSKRADIGVEKLTKEDSINYKEEVTDNKITITFDKFTGLTLYTVDISGYTNLTTISTLPKGRVKYILTQGDFMNSDIYEKNLSYTVETVGNLSLNHFDKNKKLDIWVVGDNALNGSICLELYNE